MTPLKPAAREAVSNVRRLEILKDLVAAGPLNSYAILDGAVVAGLPGALSGSEHAALMAGTLTPDLAEVSPYVVAIAPDDAVLELIAKSWDLPWGIFAFSEASFQVVSRHFRQILTVHDEAGKPMLFRFYDPRVLPVFLEASTPAEIDEVFGPAGVFTLTGEGAGLVRLGRKDGKLVKS